MNEKSLVMNKQSLPIVQMVEAFQKGFGSAHHVMSNLE